MKVELISFNPMYSPVSGRLGKLLPWRKPLNNFGDLLGPIVVQALLRDAGLSLDSATCSKRLLTIGSILHFAADYDVIWGSGRNGKIAETQHRFTQLDVRAVRGPLTRSFLQARGIVVPNIYGDPAQLLPELKPDLIKLATASPIHDVTYVPNYNDAPFNHHSETLLDPRSPIDLCLERIATSRLVVGSSLHAIIVAESLNIPARLIRSRVENEFKYNDYYLATNRPQFRMANTFAEAIKLGGEAPPKLSLEPLRAAFPYDLWGQL